MQRTVEIADFELPRGGIAISQLMTMDRAKNDRPDAGALRHLAASACSGRSLWFRREPGVAGGRERHRKVKRER